MKRYIIILLIVILSVFAVGCGGVTDSEKTSSDSEETITTESEDASASDYSDVATTWELGEGYYTAGIDIPVGTFDVTAIEGIGFISSYFDAANLRGPEYPEDAFDDYSPTFNNYSFGEDDRLEVSGVRVKLEYSSIGSDVKGRSYDEASGIELTPGYYTVGEDLDAGCYCVKYLSGDGGFVSSDFGELNANMDGDPETGNYFDYLSNVILVDGEAIEITSGLTVLFIPEKR